MSQAKRFKSAWRRAGAYALLLVVLVVMGYGGAAGWRAWREAAERARPTWGELHEQGLVALREGRFHDAEGAFVAASEAAARPRDKTSKSEAGGRTAAQDRQNQSNVEVIDVPPERNSGESLFE